MIFSGILLYNQNEVIPADKIGKITTVLFYISIFTLAFDRQLGFYFLCFAVISAISSLINYYFMYLKLRKVA